MGTIGSRRARFRRRPQRPVVRIRVAACAVAFGDARENAHRLTVVRRNLLRASPRKRPFDELCLVIPQIVVRYL
jgi:hypothetical protein